MAATLRLSLALTAALTFMAQAQAAPLPAGSIDAARLLPPPPAAGSPRAKAEVVELHAIARRSTPAMLAAARRDDKDETPALFNTAVGLDLTALPATANLLAQVHEEEEADSKPAKAYFQRDRPWIVDHSIAACGKVAPGPAKTSYPSGHATTAFAMGVVLASLIPEKAQAILARSSEFAENRLICGMHFRSDIVAGQELGTVIAVRLMADPGFQKGMEAARAELHASHPVN